MKKYILFFLLTINCIGEEISAKKLNQIVSAIYKIEGGDKARVPYGILGVKVKNKAEARRVCENTVRNNWRRWQAGGKKGEYLSFLADRYCPKKSDPIGNKNWNRNIRTALGKSF